MQIKHFITDPELLVEDSLKSLCLAQPDLTLDLRNKTIYGPKRKDGESQVSVISGGGAGHEPSFTGFVGDGLLSAAVSGSVFASPSSRQVLSAIQNVDASKGILVTVMRYTGDVMNFGVAVEKARAQNSEMKIEMLVVGDDVAVTRSRAGKVGRRGIAGTVLVHKVTGAMAAAGFSLNDIVRVGSLLTENLASIGVSLSRVHVPGRPIEDGSENPDDIELGMGIHNETGCGRRTGNDAELPAVVSEMLRQILDSNDPDRNYLLQRTPEMILLVNNLGALSTLELGAIVTEVVKQLQRDYQVNAVRVYAGTYMTSLDGPGFSITLLNTIETGVRKSLLELLDAPSNARGWQALERQDVSARNDSGKFMPVEDSDIREKPQADLLVCDIDVMRRRLEAGLKALIDSEPEVTSYDDIVGDGDCGTTLKRGAEGMILQMHIKTNSERLTLLIAILDQLSKTPPSGIVALIALVTSAVEGTMDGTSGALYAIFLNSVLHHVKLASSQAIPVDSSFWSETLSAALSALSKYTPARVGDRTMMDTLIPFADTLKATGELQAASTAAKEGAMKTKSMRPGLGRTVYIGDEDAWLGKIPDPGAWGLSKLFEGLARG